MNIEKEDWLIAYIKKHGAVDHMNELFVEEYIQTFKVKFQATNFGAFKCKDINLQLSNMYKQGILNRGTVGIHGMVGMDFPRWVYVYDLNDSFK
jgi:hypothetical protein